MTAPRPSYRLVMETQPAAPGASETRMPVHLCLTAIQNQDDFHEGGWVPRVALRAAPAELARVAVAWAMDYEAFEDEWAGLFNASATLKSCHVRVKVNGEGTVAVNEVVSLLEHPSPAAWKAFGEAKMQEWKMHSTLPEPQSAARPRL